MIYNLYITLIYKYLIEYLFFEFLLFSTFSNESLKINFNININIKWGHKRMHLFFIKKNVGKY